MKASLFNKIVSLLNLDPNTDYKILDIGCGRGELLGHLSGAIGPGCTLTGIDEMDDSIRTAQNNFPHIEFTREKFIDHLPFDDNSLDIILSVDAMECIPNKTALVDEVFRVLKPGGALS